MPWVHSSEALVPDTLLSQDAVAVTAAVAILAIAGILSIQHHRTSAPG
jgi:hypothetical protein